MAATTIISDIFAKLDGIGETFIKNAYDGLALQVNVLFGSMLTLYVLWWGYMILAGRDGFSVPEAAWRLGFLSDEGLAQRADELAKSGYGSYLAALLAYGRG